MKGTPQIKKEVIDHIQDSLPKQFMECCNIQSKVKFTVRGVVSMLGEYKHLCGIKQGYRPVKIKVETNEVIKQNVE
jgi:hypothetical protein